MAIMKYRILLAPEAVKEFKNLKAFHRAKVKDAIDKHLLYGPSRVSKSRIKKLEGLSSRNTGLKLTISGYFMTLKMIRFKSLQ